MSEIVDQDRTRAGEPLRLANDHGCFGCGRLNDFGLQMEFRENPEGDGVWARVIPAPRFEGYMGVIHGGVVTAMLDEVMAWSLYRDDAWGMTAQMSVRFRKPVIVGEPVLAIGHIVTQRGRLYETRGELRRESDNVLLADATATFMRVSAAQADAWNQRYNGDSVSAEGDAA
ncbi:MAG: PaaI family thioesterase [Thermomicrobiales bacterium]